MAELLHAEDVIFKKPSLKEFVRLIKNGTISEIWPSTQDEFNWWNGVGGYVGQDPGYKQYINPAKELTEDKLKLKSIKTAVTVFYGDNQDSAASSSLNLAATRTNFSALKLKIEGDPTDNIESWQEKIINLNYFDFDAETNLQYPKLILNESTGQINREQVDSHKSILETRFKENYSYWIDLEEKIKNFKINSSNTYGLSKPKLEEDYYKYFDNSKNGINLDNIIKSLNTSYVLDDILADADYNIQDANNNYFYFENFEKIIKEYNEKIHGVKDENGNIVVQGIKQILEKYGQSLDTENFDDNEELLSVKAKDFAEMLSNLNTDISNFIKNITNDNSNLYSKIINYKINDINATEYTSYDSLITFIDNHENLYKQLLILQANGYEVGIANQVTTEISSLKTSLETLQKTQGQTATNILSSQIELINNNYIKKINDIISVLKTSTAIRDKIDNYTPFTLLYGYDPCGLHNATITMNRLSEFYNIIIAELQINNQYIHADVTTKMTEQEYINKFNIDINDTIYENILLEQYEIDEGKTMPLEQGIEDVKSRLKKYLDSYNNLIQQVKDSGFTCVTPPDSFIINQTNKIISNKTELQQSLLDQYNKSADYINMILIISPGASLQIQKLNTDYNTLSSNLEGVYVVVTATGSIEDFNKWVNDNFDKGKIAKTVKYLSNNTNITADNVNTNNYIPAPSEDYLSISNQDTLLTNYENARNLYQSRLGQLLSIFEEIKTLLYSWAPTYDSDAIRHYICINVGSFIQFPNESSTHPYDGAISITVDETPHYPLINGLENSISSTTRNSQVPTIGGLRSIFGQNFDKVGTKSAGDSYQPIYMSNGEFLVASNVVAGTFGTLKDNSSSGWKITNTSGSIVSIQATKVFGAVYNDYAEYRSTEAHPGRCIIENGNGTLSLSTGRLQLGANIVSDTYGFAIGETNEASCPVAVCGRVLAYPLEPKELFTPGAAVCSGPEGTISLMTREEIREWPDAIVGYVSEVPTYDTWGSDNVPVNGRIWIKIK